MPKIQAYSSTREAELLLERAEARAMQRLTEAVHGLGATVCTELGLRERIRAHPLLATGAGALAGAVLGPALFRMLAQRTFGRAPLMSGPAAHLTSLFDFVWRQTGAAGSGRTSTPTNPQN